MKRKIISVLLCVALAISVTPIVYAQDTLDSTIPITDTVNPTQMNLPKNAPKTQNTF